MGIVEYIKSLPGFRCTGGATEAEIAETEKILGLRFAEEYRSILSELGAVRVCGHEITGIVKSKSLSVVETTRSARDNEKIPCDMYVVECVGIDDIMVLQDSTGVVHLCKGTSISFAAGSLVDYLQSRLFVPLSERTIESSIAELQKAGVPADYYSVGYAEEAICIEKCSRSWIVYTAERGDKRNLRLFFTEGDACNYFVDKVLDQEYEKT